jgi:hypothetical protein
MQRSTPYLKIVKPSEIFRQHRLVAALCCGVDLHPELLKAFFGCGACLVTHGWDRNETLCIEVRASKSQDDFVREFHSKHSTIKLSEDRTISADQVMTFVHFS